MQNLLPNILKMSRGSYWIEQKETTLGKSILLGILYYMQNLIFLVSSSLRKTYQGLLITKFA